MHLSLSESSIETLLQGIASLQSKGDNYFPDGLFPSFRQNKIWSYHRPDTNIFYTATIVFTLNQLKAKVEPASKRIIDDIQGKAVKNYPSFQNKDGLKTYNFYQTNPSQHFPHGLIFHRLRHFQIPDDIDDTALVYLSQKHTEEEVNWLKNKLSFHANTVKTQIVNTLPHYRNLKAYSTWFGKNMPIEFDVCALCNLFYFIFENKLALNEFDHDSLKFLQAVVLNHEFLTHPFTIAHNYATPALIIYHYARLMGAFKIPELEVCRQKLIKHCIALISTEKASLNRIILETSLLKLSPEKAKQSLSSFVLPNQPSDFRFFIAGLLSSYETPLLHFFANKKFSQIEWQCEAHDLTLVLENLILRKSLLIE